MPLLRFAAVFCLAWTGAVAAQAAPEPTAPQSTSGASAAAPAWPDAEPVASDAASAPAEPAAAGTPASEAPAPETTDAPAVGRIWTSTDAPVSEDTAEQLRARLARMPTDAPAQMLEGVLTGRNGHTLYVFDADKRGASTCNGICIKLWPPYLATVDDAPRDGFTITERLDGGLQWVYNNRPLYFWVHDKKPGDVTGDGVNDVWHAVRE